jgi:hypothetical protein
MAGLCVEERCKEISRTKMLRHDLEKCEMRRHTQETKRKMK